MARFFRFTSELFSGMIINNNFWLILSRSKGASNKEHSLFEAPFIIFFNDMEDGRYDKTFWTGNNRDVHGTRPLH